ncbi:MAG: hypothetical protein GKS00_25590 [Alphaproteobacteria bacterium]|nr:hypothetical protein [Alphaproteobacteria bacterium]
MPRLPGVRDVTRVSTNGLRLPALNAPAPDPTGAALQEVGRSLGDFGEALDDFARKRKRLKEADERLKAQKFDADLAKGRAVSPPDGFFFEDADEDGEGETRISDAATPSADNPPLLSFEEAGDAHIKRIQNPEQQARHQKIFDGHKKFRLIDRGVEDQNIGAANLVFRVDGILDRHRETVSAKPDMIKLSLEKGRGVLRQNKDDLGWSDETLREKERAFERSLDVSLLRGRIARGEAVPVLDFLKGPDARTLLDEDSIVDLTREAAAREASEVTAILSDMDIHGAAIERAGTGLEGLPERAAAILPPE